jgi:hypothetical protein
MTDFSLEQLNTFIVRAKAAAYVGGGAKSLSYRPGSHDLQFHEGTFSYLDSYFGGADFLGQAEVLTGTSPEKMKAMKTVFVLSRNVDMINRQITNGMTYGTTDRLKDSDKLEQEGIIEYVR